MSANAGKLTLRFETDIADLDGKMTKAKNAIAGLGPALNSTNASLQQTSQNTVTAAVRFQTLTQGALNLTTSFAQTATSFSNIQRAQTGVAASTVSLQRAEDLLEKKMLRLNDERNKSVKNLDKIATLTNDLSTAEQDLAVKRQKLTDATNQANDTNLLFGINLVNVGFSAIQTGTSMLAMARSATVASGGVGLLTKSVGVLRVAFTFLQTHPVFLVVTLALIAWEAGFSKIIKGITGADYSIQALTTSALGLDKIKSSTQILGSEFNNTGEEIQFVSNTMDSTATSMITSLQSVGMSLKTLKSEFVNFSSDIQLAGQIMTGSISTKGMSVLDMIKLNSKLTSEALSDINLLLKEGHSLETSTFIIRQDILKDNREISNFLSEQLQTGKLTTEQYNEQLTLLDLMTLRRREQLAVAKEQVRQEKSLNQESKKNETNFKHGIDLANRFDIDPKSNRGIVLNITGLDLGAVANTLALPDALKKANMHTFLSQYQKFPGGGKTQGVLDYLDKQASEYIKMTNAHKLYEMTGGRMGTQNKFGPGFFNATGATAAYQVPRGSIRASNEFYANLKKMDAWANSLEAQDLKAAASHFTGGFRGYTGGNEKKARKLSQSESQTLSLAGALGFRPSNLNTSLGTTATVDSMIAESSAFLSTKTGSIPGSMLSSAMSISIQRGNEAYRNYRMSQPQFRSGSPADRLQMRDAFTLKQQSAASLFNNISSRFNGGNYGEYDATVMSTLLGATFAHPEIAQEYTSFQTKIAPILGITHNEFTSVLSESARGFSEIDDRMRYKGRLEQISTGATVF